MKQKEFFVFRALIADVCAKAFGEQLSTLPHNKAQMLSWMIHDATGELLSYRSLANYVAAVTHDAPDAVNPTDATLAILARYVTGGDARCDRHEMRMGAHAAWYRYRSRALTQLQAA